LNGGITTGTSIISNNCNSAIKIFNTKNRGASPYRRMKMTIIILEDKEVSLTWDEFVSAAGWA
jgi:hypothetical protein